MKDVGMMNVLCLGGEVPMPDLRRLVAGSAKLNILIVSWEDAFAALRQSSFDFLVMDSWDTGLDDKRAQIMASLTVDTTVFVFPRLVAAKELAKRAPSPSPASAVRSLPVAAGS